MELYLGASRNIPSLHGGEVTAATTKAPEFPFVLSTSPNLELGEGVVPVDAVKTLESCGVKHGDMFFAISPLNPDSCVRKPVERGQDVRISLLPVDSALEKEKGMISRPRNPRFCHHGMAGMCSHCQPLEPYDPQYAEEAGIKYLSFYAYLRKQKAHTRTALLALEEPFYGVRPGCQRHPPYPAGICSACQPSAITLNPQPFRFTDHVEFAQARLIDTFLSEGWRKDGCQRFAWLFGRYETYDGVPLGIKASILALYSPPQEASPDGFQLKEDPRWESILTAASELDLYPVGMLYTDLHDDGSKRGRVENHRNADNYFVSSAECLFIAQQQLAHPNACRYSPTGTFGSKFVTVTLSGDEDGNVGLFCYQVSLQCQSMAREGLIEATTEPSLMMVSNSAEAEVGGDKSKVKYVPDVFYKVKSSFGGELQKSASPTFPVDYFLISITHGFPVSPATDAGDTAEAPSLQNSPVPPIDANQDAIRRYLLPLPADGVALLRLLCNFNFFVAIHTGKIFPKHECHLLADIILKRGPGSQLPHGENCTSPQTGREPPRNKSRQLELQLMLLDQLTSSPGWRQLVGPVPVLGTSEAPIDLSKSTTSDGWTCPHCTFINSNLRSDTCDLCNLPRNY